MDLRIISTEELIAMLHQIAEELRGRLTMMEEYVYV